MLSTLIERWREMMDNREASSVQAQQAAPGSSTSIVAAVDLDAPTFHFISFRYPDGDRAQGFYELDLETATSRKKIVEAIADWEWEGIDKIYEASDWRFADITEDIAREVLTKCVREDPTINWSLQGWLENHLGLREVEEAMVENGTEIV